MFVAQIENKRGDVLTLTRNESEYQIISIEGLNPPNAQINTLTMANIDGARFNSSKLETREIVITLQLNGSGADVEANRQNLYKFFPTKEWCKFYFTNNYRNVFIEAYVNTVEVSPFTNAEQMQISLICPQPYFKAVNMIIDDISKRIACFEFPFAFGSDGATNPDVPTDPETDEAIPFSEIDTDKITNVYNNSESEAGMIIEVYVIQPINNVTIQNTKTGEFLTLNYNFITSDKITINTNKGEKSISLVRDGVTINIFTALVKGSTFFQLGIGDNYFSFTLNDGAEDSAVNILFKHYATYRGV